jgi:tyrosyl-tRNA synthetase
MLALREELEQRGLLKQFSNEDFFELYDKGGQVLYIGMDPSADSLTIGNFAMFMTALQFMKRGNKLIFIIGGETGMIGDPGGKEAERSLLSLEELEKNIAKIDQQVAFLLKNINEISGMNYHYEIKNNHDFYKDMTFGEFLRDVGKYITVNTMMKKETVAKRIEDPDKSISFTEFSYMLIQGYDFVRLYQDYGCKLQICGSDQWGNGVTGLELIGKILGKNDAYVMTSPLILDSQGKKFGKSEGNAVWLSEEKNSAYLVYQYFMNVPDEDVSRFLKIYSLLDLAQIQEIQNKHNEDPAKRFGQEKLAFNICRILFWTVSAAQARQISEFMFRENKTEFLKQLSIADRLSIKKEVWGWDFKEGSTILDALVESGLCESRGDAKKLIAQGGISVDGVAVTDTNLALTKSNMLIQKWKKSMRVVL